MKSGGKVLLHKDDEYECAPGMAGKDGVCSVGKMIAAVKKFLLHLDQDIEKMSRKEMIERTMHLLNIKNESEIYNHEGFKEITRFQIDEDFKDTIFKPEGPKCSTELLSNRDIDSVLNQWSEHSKKDPNYYKNGPFYHMMFDMIDFKTSEPNRPFNQFDIVKCANAGFKSAACVLNTDVWAGNGIHWFCIYVDLTGDGTKSSPYCIEFFNSSGNYPRDEIVEWIERKKMEAAQKGKVVTMRKAVSTEIQKSETECGVWCLWFIKSRLCGKPPGFFEDHGVSDDDITEARQFIFRKR